MYIDVALDTAIDIVAAVVPDAALALCPDCRTVLHIGDWPMGCRGSMQHKALRGGYATNLSAIHTSERATIFRNPRTGEVRIPAHTRQPMHVNYASQGYVREEIRTHADRVQLERTTGRIQEQAYFDVNTGSAERSLLTGIKDAPPIRGLDESAN